jgi:hypothetical protein
VDRGEIVIDPTLIVPSFPRLIRCRFLLLKVLGHPKHHTSHSRSSSQAVSYPPTYVPLLMPRVYASTGVEHAGDGGEVGRILA